MGSLAKQQKNQHISVHTSVTEIEIQPLWQNSRSHHKISKIVVTKLRAYEYIVEIYPWAMIDMLYDFVNESSQ